MDSMKTDNLTEEQKMDITFQANALGEAIAENAALRSRLETLEQKLQALMETKGHNQQKHLDIDYIGIMPQCVSKCLKMCMIQYLSTWPKMCQHAPMCVKMFKDMSIWSNMCQHDPKGVNVRQNV